MSKRTFFLTIILFFVVSAVLYNYYLKTKKELKEVQRYVYDYEKKAKEIKYLQNKYKSNVKMLKRYCNIALNNEKYMLTCKVKNKKEFGYILKKVFDKRNNILKFSISKDQITAEIGK